MKVPSISVIDILFKLRAYFQGEFGINKGEHGAPIRAELYSADQMEEHGSVLARSHKFHKRNTSNQLLKRLANNEKTLLEVRNLLVESIKDGKVITPAAEWLIDNYYLIEEQFVIAKKHFPKKYSEGLPHMSSGNSEGLPRVYDIVLELISHSDGRVDIRTLSSFIAAYQSEKILTLGELWALPIMLRIAVLENLRRIGAQIALDMIDYNLAEYWSNQFVSTIQNAPTNLILDIADMARTKPILSGPFVAGLTRNLQGKGQELMLPLTWMEQQLGTQGINSLDMLRQENQRQAADQVSVRNSIGTLRFLGSTDWHEFVETLSNVESILKKDITGIYPKMDFVTRDSYRHVVETIAKSSLLTETEVAQKILDLSKQQDPDFDSNIRRRHIGYFLIDKGLSAVEKAANVRYPWKEILQKWINKQALGFYFGATLLTGVLVLIGTVWTLEHLEAYNLLLILLTFLSFSLVISQFAISFINWLVTITVKPRLMPKMNFSGGIPSEHRTLVVIPTLLTNEEYIDTLTEGLEIRYLANKDPHLHFGLLTDFMDADTQHSELDEILLNKAVTEIERLNLKYVKEKEDIFFLFHRDRKWNPAQNKWMGYERKRGKLSALNALILGSPGEKFSKIVGHTEVLSNVKYVITLDSDTQLPRDAAWKLVATMAHPLNKPAANKFSRYISSGYTILQPRVASKINPGAITPYLRLQGMATGIDPYTRMSSDVYQDLFGEGSFIGKGIYDVAVFEQIMKDALPENRILSHDLLEGNYTRSGLVSDVLLYEENPSQYWADIKRQERWIRGDWQIASWIFPFIKNMEGKWVSNPISTLSKWKIIDNLRRSLFPLALLIAFVLVWLFTPNAGWWTTIFCGLLVLPVLISSLWQAIHRPADLTIRAHVVEVGDALREGVTRFIFNLAVLQFEAFVFTSAILRTLWRMFITKKHLLEWTPSVSISFTEFNIAKVYRWMWISPLLSAGLASFLLYFVPYNLIIAAPVLVIWFLGPVIVWWFSSVPVESEDTISAENQEFLYKSARKTWAYFAQFVTEKDNWLPPDNFQEQPVAAIAHRTSPTNIGLALLSNLAAYDLGFISTGKFLDRTSNTMSAMQRLDRFKGHFFNWYDTQSMQTLYPRYISTVDSGNLAGHLLILKQGLILLLEAPLMSGIRFKGLCMTLQIFKDLSDENVRKHIKRIEKSLQSILSQHDLKISHIKNCIAEIELIILNSNFQEQTGNAKNQYWWNEWMEEWADLKSEFGMLRPLVSDQESMPEMPNSFDTDSIPGLQDLYDKLVWLCKNDKVEIRQKGIYTDTIRVLENRIRVISNLIDLCEAFSDIEYDFLFDRATNLLRIGYNVDEHRGDESYYDLLASEARLGIFVAIAQGKLPQDAWFALGRLLTNSGGAPVLLSWSGSMFEYLMPQLVMPSYDYTLLTQTNIAAVNRQIQYGGHRSIPWGISESGYNRTDAGRIYQYRAFGVPGLGLKRGLEEDLVIAPYASMLALMVQPEKSIQNLKLLASKGFEGKYGFYEAIDYTPARTLRGKSHSVVQSYMVHHQGMSLLSMAYTLLNQPMQQRFLNDLRFQATLLLLQEKVPRATIFYAHTADIIETQRSTADVQIRTIKTPNSPIPEIQLLSNGNYQVMLSNSGSGYSKWKNLSLTRWRPDGIQDHMGAFCYLKDIISGEVWSNTYQPTLAKADVYEAIFSHGHIEYRRSDHGIETKTDIVISPEDDVEMRRIKISNRTNTLRVIEVTSYAEVVIAPQAADEAHPAFSNLFVQTEILSESKAIVSTRRPRSADENPPWMFHHMDAYNAEIESVSYETDRMKFVGRGRQLSHPAALDVDLLQGNQGAVLDPIMSIRIRIRIKPGQTAIVDKVYGISETKDHCYGLLHKYRDRYLKKRAFELFWTHSQMLLRQINASESDGLLYDRLAASVIFINPALRADSKVIASNFRGQSNLWSHSISGDLPIVIVHVSQQDNLELVKQLVQAHSYWRLKGLEVDLIIINDDHGSYRQALHDQILSLTAGEAGGHHAHGKPGSIFVKSADQISSEDRILFESVARIILYDTKGTLLEQMNKSSLDVSQPPMLETRPSQSEVIRQPVNMHEVLQFPNGIGGFNETGTEYKMLLQNDKKTPAPWVNVIANPLIGTVISESGSAYTWAVNAHSYRLSPWSNDPVCDKGGEAFYIRNEHTGEYWSPAVYPAQGNDPYICTHGFGYSKFEHHNHSIRSEMTVFVDKVKPLKFVVIRIKNLSGSEQKLSCTGYLDVVLGDLKTKTGMHIISEFEPQSSSLFFQNRNQSSFANRISFFNVNSRYVTYTADRSEFIGRNKNLSQPESMSRSRLSGRVGAGMDACGAFMVQFDLLDGAEKEVVFIIGSSTDRQGAIDLINQFSDNQRIKQSLDEVRQYWKSTLNRISIQTPDPALNTLANGWLMYQNISARLMARSGFYQSGGAIGFRDQLQDVLSVLLIQPELARNQILLSASRQFIEGDVQHWWHPPEGRGVRTRCSDDLLWLPYVVSRYVEVTGDEQILSEEAHFLESRLLHPGEESLYDLPAISPHSGSIFDHCTRAIRKSLVYGEHGLPLIGSGDWNDGMDRVGLHGKGESVWLAFFLYDVMRKFKLIAERFGNREIADLCESESRKLQENIEVHAWDGSWYKRAWMDSGAELGSVSSPECSIDAIAQSWSVISGAGSAERQQVAMLSLDQHLVRRDLQLIQLLNPPFDDNGPNPGYIRGYVPGVRENGGQYSHAAVWALIAFSKLKDREKVYELFSMIQPIGHSDNGVSRDIYKVEPYVLAADVYANESHQGRGGWTWYTGSAGWLYQFILHYMLGFDLKENSLHLQPCFPKDWPSVQIKFQNGSGYFKLIVYQTETVEQSWWKMDGKHGLGDKISLPDDAAEHDIEFHFKI